MVGITTLLFKTEAGAVLIDGSMPQAAPVILDHLKQIGVAPGDVETAAALKTRMPTNVGSTVTRLQHATGAVVVSNAAESAGADGARWHNDLHYGDSIVFPARTATRLLQDREAVHLSSLRLQVWSHARPTPLAALSWTWTDTRGGKATAWRWWTIITCPATACCRAPSTRASSKSSSAASLPSARCPCDVLITPHPDIFWLAVRQARQPAPRAPELHRLRRPRGREYAQQLEAQRPPNSKTP